MDLDAARRADAEEQRVRAQLRSEPLARAFATVPREHFLGPGPWQVMAPDTLTYVMTADAPASSTGTSSSQSTRHGSSFPR
jgi:protein-L-isoaspartate(D-aspartate) O-methyltransferase